MKLITSPLQGISFAPGRGLLQLLETWKIYVIASSEAHSDDANNARKWREVRSFWDTPNSIPATLGKGRWRHPGLVSLYLVSAL